MGLMPDEFYNMTLYEYRCIICKRKFDDARKLEHTRLITYTIVKVNGGCKDVSIQDFRPLLTDYIPKQLPAPSKEDIELLRQRAQESVNRFANMREKK